jgi:hypothetical protein
VREGGYLRAMLLNTEINSDVIFCKYLNPFYVPELQKAALVLKELQRICETLEA